MCGINGILGLESLDRPREIIGKMNDALAHRGPDADGIFLSEDVVLGHRRLSIIDLSDASNQPFREQSDRYTIVYNGELYNFKEIKARLSDYPFLTDCDTEVVLAAYMKWGADCLQYFNGMFAFAVWDEEKKELFIARDRLGIKPLYYSYADSALIFSSEMRALMSSGLVKKKVRKESVVDFLRYQTVHSPHTILEGVKVLPSGHYFRVQDNEHEITQYWDASWSRTEMPSMSHEQVKKKTKELLYESVERRTIADVPFGAFLSGGIDSSAIVGLMSQSMDTQVSTFSVTFAEEEFSEAKYARQIAEKFNTAHTEIQLSPEEFLKDLPHSLKSMDHPSGDGPNTYVISKATKAAGITMALSGLGGDELFAGYELFRTCADLNEKRWLTSFPKVLRRGVGLGLNTLKPSIRSRKINELLKLDATTLDYVYPMMRRVLLDQEIDSLIKNGSKMKDPVRQLAEEMGPSNKNLPFLSQVSVLELSTYMQHVLLRDSDQMSMAHALEVRVPFLDHNLVEFALAIDDSVKYPHTPKKLLTDALGEMLPDSIVNRPKMGFTFPWDSWMRNELFDLCDKAIDSLKRRDLMSEQGIDELWKKFLNRDPNVSYSRIWPLVVLETWMQNNGVEA